jgi:hypothetical protein
MHSPRIPRREKDEGEVRDGKSSSEDKDKGEAREREHSSSNREN